MVGPAAGALVDPRPAVEVRDRCRADDFERLVGPCLGELHVHCYRMLGSVHDSDDALQDALLRAWRGLPAFDQRRPVRPWLYKIATNACRDLIAKRVRRGIMASSAWHGACPEAPWIEPYPEQPALIDGYASPEARYEQREAVELAFIAALQNLAPRQRAVLILRDVLGFSAKEAADLLDVSAMSVDSALARARRAIDQRLPDTSQQATLRSVGAEPLRVIARRFMDAFESGEVQAILALMSEEVSFSMPAQREYCRGREAVSRSWLMPSGPPGSLRYIPTRANAQLAFGVYRLDHSTGLFLPHAVDVVALQNTDVTAVAAFRGAEMFAHLGLPGLVDPTIPSQNPPW
jgi:RNA polymerase sigma-70 factor (ECF subfamily)